jgi:transposase
MPSARPLRKEQVVLALNKTKSVKAAGRFLGVSYQHIKKWALLYRDKESGLSLFEKHKNRSGRGIPKYFGKKEPPLIEIIEGRVDSSYFTPKRIKERLLEEDYIQEECSSCGFRERRLVDGKVPLLFHFKDSNRRNYSLTNVTLICYNCYFLTVGNIFSNKEIDSIEDYTKEHQKKQITWELSDFHKAKMKELGLMDDEKDDLINNI